MAALASLAVIALSAVVTVVLAVMVVRRHPIVGLGAMGVIVLLQWEMPFPPPIVTVADLSVYPADLITVVLAAVGALEARQLRENLRGWLFPWLVFGVLIAASTLRGAAAFGPGVAINEARALLYFFFAMTWVLATRPDRIRLHTFSLGLGWALVLVALYHGVRYGIGTATSSVALGDDVRRTGRILVSSQAEALLLCAGIVFLGPVRSRQAHRRDVLSAVVFLGIVLLAQHRSVWVAGALGMAAVLLWSKQSRARSRVFVLAAIGAWLALLSWTSGFLEGIGSEFVESASTRGTLDWRTSSWQVLISRAFDQGLGVVMAGEPFGGGYLRQLDSGRWTAAAAHGWYVTILLRVGIAGLVALAVVLIGALVKSRAVAAGSTFSLVAVAGFGLFYTVDWFLAPWLGVAMIVSLGVSLQKDHTGRGQDRGIRQSASTRSAVNDGR